MIGYTFTWNGSKESLLAFSITTLLIVESESSDSYMEEVIPKSYLNIYNPRKDISSFFTEDLIQDFIITSCNKINNEGDYSIYKSKNRLINRYIELNLTDIKKVTSPNNWIERLSIIYAIKCWQRQLKIWDTIYNSVSKKSFLKLEKNKRFHKEYLAHQEVLLPIYDWYKVIDLFKDDSIKPNWYHIELYNYKRLIGEL